LLWQAVFSNDVEAVDLLFNYEPDMEIGDIDGTKPLHIAIFEPDRGIAERLLKRGANVNSRRNSGDTPFHWALQRSSLKMLQLLYAHGADPKLCNFRGHCAEYHLRVRDADVPDERGLISDWLEPLLRGHAKQ
jgi:ankyrin repeat protein